MSGAQDVNFILVWLLDGQLRQCGKHDDNRVITDFASSIGGSPYLQMNSLYVNGSGHAPSGAMFYAVQRIRSDLLARV
jgi:hypothetical protein